MNRSLTMKRALVVYAHPEPTSFTAALKDCAIDVLRDLGFQVEVSDLYGENFNPVAGRHDFMSESDSSRFHYQSEQLAASKDQTFSDEIRREQERVGKADLFVFVFPLWWGGVPAILKGWFDRVLAYGFAYADGKRYEHGYFLGKRGVLAISTGGTEHRFSAGGSYGEMSTVLHGVSHCMLGYLGLETSDPFVAYAAPRVGDEERGRYLQQWRAYLAGIATSGDWLAHGVPQPSADAEPGPAAEDGWDKMS
ncbi:NAD(P)H-dependent oxidoreductase [Pandoraea terrigena]|uniref:NAD(P)H dehydrogenase n=1 Tax=Pandoraea terrigena TaxID=2508292 RepID=A0A5E4WKV9_9BURK|nr:NAD(P)H-dependent oxidoreductase [Pandoraea terrigena]VVE25432.1 NAD(P)H dehydrogenase [Pandoraea terrigena]